MSKLPDPLNAIGIAAPCEATWERMAGDERVRYCTACDLNVYNLAEMTCEEIRELVARTEGRLCARLSRRADGTLLTSDRPSAFRALRRRMSRLGAAAGAALVGASSILHGCATLGERSTMKLAVEQTAAAQEAVLAGIIRDETDNPLPGVSITLQDEVSKKESSHYGRERRVHLHITERFALSHRSLAQRIQATRRGARPAE
jgi:hypothetical protein